MLTVAIDYPIHIASCISRRDAQYLGSVSSCCTCFYIAQLATGDLSVRTEPEGSSVLGERQGPHNLTQVLGEEGHHVQQGFGLPCHRHVVPARHAGPTILSEGYLAVHDP